MRRLSISTTDDLDANFDSEEGLFALLTALSQNPKFNSLGQASFRPPPEEIRRAFARYVVERYLGRRQFYDLLSLCEAAINPIRFTREVVSNDASLIVSLLGKVGVVHVGDLCTGDFATSEQRELMFERMCDAEFPTMVVREKWLCMADARLVQRHVERLCGFWRSCVEEMAESQRAAAELEAKFEAPSRPRERGRPPRRADKSTANLGHGAGIEVAEFPVPKARWPKWVEEAVPRTDDVAHAVQEHVRSITGGDRVAEAAAALAFTREFENRSAFTLALRLALPGGMGPVLGPLMADPESALCKADVATACAVLDAVGVRPDHFFIEERDPQNRVRRGELVPLVPGAFTGEDDTQATVVALCDRNGPRHLPPVVVAGDFVREWREHKRLAEEYPFSQCVCKSAVGERCEAGCQAFVPVVVPAMRAARGRRDEDDLLSSVSTAADACTAVDMVLACVGFILPVDYPEAGILRSRGHVEAVVAAQSKPDPPAREVTLTTKSSGST